MGERFKKGLKKSERTAVHASAMAMVSKLEAISCLIHSQRTKREMVSTAFPLKEEFLRFGFLQSLDKTEGRTKSPNLHG